MGGRRKVLVLGWIAHVSTGEEGGREGGEGE